jgi:hypothetical protein
MWLVALGLAALPLQARAELPALLRSENSDVREGNEKLQKGDAKGALASYDVAARSLPDSPGVQLDRGLALLKAGELPKARESLLAATQPSAPPALRADAYHNLALAFYREGDQLAGQKNHKEAQQRFRESVDASKRALRLRPGDPNVAWNLELAARRIREEEEKQKQEDEQKKQDEQKKDDQQKDDQDQKQPDDQQGDQDQKQDPDQDQAKKDEPKPDSKGQEPPKQDQAKQDDKGKDKGEPNQPEPKPDESQGEQAQQPELPAEAEQALDALSDGEENFERYRARQRASRERRAPEKDW